MPTNAQLALNWWREAGIGGDNMPIREKEREDEKKGSRMRKKGMRWKWEEKKRKLG